MKDIVRTLRNNAMAVDNSLLMAIGDRMVAQRTGTQQKMVALTHLRNDATTHFDDEIRYV